MKEAIEDDVKLNSLQMNRDLWRVVRKEEWTVADWWDFHQTLEQFKARLIARHSEKAAEKRHGSR